MARMRVWYTTSCSALALPIILGAEKTRVLFFLMPAAASNVSHQPITSHVSARACAVYTLSFGMDPQSFDK